MKKTKNIVILFGTSIILILGCKKSINPSTRLFSFPEYIDTETKEILIQEKKVFDTGMGVFASNIFEGGKLNGFKVLNDSTFEVLSLPENRPINPSPWYSFKLWSSSPKDVYIQFNYDGEKHRYNPKTTMDGQTWKEINTKNIVSSGKITTAKFAISKDTLWVSAQELFTSSDLKSWINNTIAKHPETKDFEYGKSKLGRTLSGLKLFTDKSKQKEVIVLMSRQHPPEVTGQFAFLHFVERLMIDDELTRAFKEKYQVLLFPIQNPDGVDLGHWRHNAGGIDLNRDWDRYNQPETRQMADYIANFKKEQKAKVVLGIDFHSTYEDVYYTNKSDTATVYPLFANTWLKEIKNAIPNYDPNIAPSNVGQPVSKGWFFIEHQAVGITYEIGDTTPRDFIELKSKIAAEKMMKVLLETKK